MNQISKIAYARRRENIIERVSAATGESEGVIFLEGANEVERNPQAPHRFRQSPHVQYLTGLNHPDISIMLDLGSGEYTVFAPHPEEDHEIWEGKPLTHDRIKRLFGADNVRTPDKIEDVTGWPVYSVEGRQGIFAEWAETDDLRRLMADMRLVKSAEEVRAIESALAVTKDSYLEAMNRTGHGVRFGEIRGALANTYETNDATWAFQPIATAQGYTLHAKPVRGTMRDGQLLLVDSGAQLEYASDITRVWPVSGTFTDEQAEVYDIVSAAKKLAIGMMGPGVNFKEVHLKTEELIAQGLVDIGVLRGNVSDILENGAHRMFFMHGLGHHMGLDVHDCGDWEKDLFKDPHEEAFGIKYLRFVHDLARGHVITVEPGIYFNPAVLNDSAVYGKHREFMRLGNARSLIRSVGGIRLEDDVLVTPKGAKVLGFPIPENRQELEEILGRAA